MQRLLEGLLQLINVQELSESSILTKELLD